MKNENELRGFVCDTSPSKVVQDLSSNRILLTDHLLKRPRCEHVIHPGHSRKKAKKEKIGYVLTSYQ